MKISKLRLKNIGVFDDTTFDFSTNNDSNIHILTGQNGCGKTTVLLALAGAFRTGIDHNSEGESLKFLAKRFRYFELEPTKSKSSSSKNYKSLFEVFFNTEKDHVVLIGCPFCKKNPVHVKNKNYMGTPQTEEERNTNPNDSIAVANYRQLLDQKSIETPLKFAVFAYSGYRFINNQNLNTLEKKEPLSPLSGSLDFIKEYESNSLSLLRWVDSSLSNYYIAKDQEGELAAKKYKESVEIVQQILSEIIGKEVRFSIKASPRQVLLTIDNQPFDLDMLPDGLRSLLSWIADLLMRLDMLPWENNTPILERNIILLLDEIEVHLHPQWQRKVLPVVKKLFKNAQIFVSTHSPFVVNSIDGAYIHKINLQGSSVPDQKIKRIISDNGKSVQTVLESLFDTKEHFGLEVERDLAQFYLLRNQLLNGEMIDESKFLALAAHLAKEGLEVQNIVQFEMRQINRIAKKSYAI